MAHGRTSSPRLGSRLATCGSPYLQQHAGNPVDWWPWSPEAVEEARRRDAPFDAAGANLRHLVFDMTGVQGMSSMGLGFCIAFRNEAARRGADCLVIGIGEDLLDLFRLTKIDSLFRICRTDADLRKALEG